MPTETAAAIALHASFDDARPGSGWLSWAPDVMDVADTTDADAQVDRLGGMLCVLMWGCASLLAVWYL